MNTVLPSKPSESQPRRHLYRWSIILIAFMVVALGLYSLSRPRGYYWRGRTFNLGVETLATDDLYRDKIWVRDTWEAPNTGIHGDLYGFRIGNRLLRLNINYDPASYLKAHLPSSVGELLKMLEERDYLGRKCAIEALTKLGPKCAEGLPHVLRRIETGDQVAEGDFMALALAAGPAACPYVASALTNKAPQVVASAIQVLGEMNSNALDAVPALVPLLTNGVRTNQLAVAYALSKIDTNSDYGAVSTLSRLLSDTDPNVSVGAVVILGEFGQRAAPATEHLFRFMANTDLESACYVARTFGLMGPTGAVALTQIIPLLRHHELTNLNLAVMTLGNLGEAGALAVPALCELLEQKEIAPSVADALGDIGTNSLPCFLNAYEADKPDDGLLSRNIYKMGTNAIVAVPTLVRELTNQSPYRAARAAYALGAIGENAREAAPVLRRLMNDENGQLRMSAAEALWRIDHDTNTVLKVMLAELTEWSKEPDTLRRTSSFGYGYESQSCQQIAARVLGEIGPAASAAVPLLEYMALSMQKEDAKDALKKILGL